ncbi:MAG: internalization-related competence protein ComEC/Rec2, partial [Gemmatimonadetes bacterium]|nr:internalization-related competence protein ComEC/Rec2 [Gemmatimonadota bacterium]
MPLVAWSTLTYAASLIAAFSTGNGGRVALGAMALAAAGILALNGRRTAATVSAVGAAAVMIAASTMATDTRCGASLSALAEWSADLETDAASGDVARAALTGNGCTVRATLLVTSGNAGAGGRTTVTGTASMGERGLLVADAHLTSPMAGPITLRAQAAAGRRIDRIFGTDAPMVRALVIADMSGIPAEQRDRFARAGLVHMISVSGLHVGIVALALELLASVLRLPPRPARIATMMLLVAYVAVIGAPPPAMRAAVMLAAVLVTRLVQRPTSPWAILALGAAAPLWNSHTALDLGWQLSVLGTASLIAGGTLARRIIPKKWRGTKRSLASAAVVSIVATAVTAPLVAWTFGRISLLGPVTNLLADPVMGLLQPLLFLAVAVPVHGIEALSADAAH